MAARPSQLAPILLSVLRIVAGLIFLEHGTQKFLSFPPGPAAGSGLAFANLGAYAGLIEAACGLLIAIGLFTRPAAFLASGVMAVAYWTGHFPRDFFPVNNMGDAAILYCFVFLYISAAGAGPWSVDAARNKGRLPPP
jgi:putative oxidoreductase